MLSPHYVIIGNGAAGNGAADALRERDPDARITIIADEFFPFYYRHCLREYIVGDKDDDALVVRPPAYYKERRIRLRLGQTVTRIDFEKRVLFLAHMEKVRYDKLLLCTGSKPRIPEIYHAASACFTVLNTLTHARALRQRLATAHAIVIMGGDMVSCRIAATLRAKGKHVLFFVDRDAFWPLALDDERRNALASALGARGIEILAGGGIARIEPAAAGGATLTLRDGSAIACDVLGAFFGLVPNVDFLLGSGLDIERGILVDEFLQTNIPDVYAAGDCAQVYNPALKNYWVSIGWPNALRLGELAAANMLGAAAAANEPPASVLACDGVKVETAWWKEL
jgi:NADPH-dependent 2,4-dienoyl-CoA reductase/sulfur reductase-like enzyme